MTSFETGDVVRCISTGYQSVKPGQTRVVLGTRDAGNGFYQIWLHNPYSPKEGSWFAAFNFELVSRAMRPKKEKKVAEYTLNVAVKVSDNGSEELGYGYIANAINDLKAATHLSMMAETSGEALKTRLRQRVAAYPEERWLILSGTVVAEIAAPPVRFRSL